MAERRKSRPEGKIKGENDMTQKSGGSKGKHEKKRGAGIVRNLLLAVTALLAVALWCIVLVRHFGSQEVSHGEIVVVETPDRTESAQHPLFIREVYEPVIPAGVNIAQMAKIEADSFTEVYTPRKVKDGKTAGQSYWEGAPDSYPNILTASFEEEYGIHAIKVCLCPQSVWGARTQTFSVEISRDGENFEELLASADYEFNPDTANEVVLEFDEVTCRAVRLVFTANTGAGGAQVAELELYSEDENAAASMEESEDADSEDADA